MKIIVTRHGQTDWNVLGKLQGHLDIELNDMGRKQAKEMGKLIKNENIDLIITSPLKRTKKTAEIINTNFQVNIVEDNRLIERDYGIMEGLTKNEIKKAKEVHPEINEIWNYNKNININNIETMKHFCNRIYQFLDEMLMKYQNKNILIVTHGGVSVPIQYYFNKYPLDKLINRETIKGLKNCEIIKYDLIGSYFNP